MPLQEADVQDKLTGDEHRDDFLIEMGFTSVEIAKIQTIRLRPRTHQGRRSDVYPIPKLYSEYKAFHKRCFADVFGDGAAEAIFGIGPWLASERRKECK
jgi:hypothetical protein